MNNTKLMDKLFSEENEELRTQVADKVEEAKQNGSSELITDEENLQFADTGDGIVVEDQANNNEVTMMKENEDGDGYDMEAVDVTAETKSNSDGDELNEKMTTLEENVNEVADAAEDMNETKDKEMAKAVKEMSQKLFSDIEDLEKEHEDVNFEEVKEKCNKYAELAEEILNAPDVQTPVAEGKDGDHLTDSAPEVKVEVSTGIDDPEKAGLKNFSITFSGNCDPSYIAAVSKAFAEVAASPEAEPAKDPENSKNEDLETLVENANELAEAAKQMKEANDKDMAKSVKEMSQKIFSDAEELEVEGEDEMKVAEVKEQCNKYSSEAEEILGKEDEPKTEPEPAPEDTVSEETQKNFSHCLGYDFTGVSIAPRSEIKQEQKTFSATDNKDGYVNPCLVTRI